jgi:molybdate transport system substrate-binding protein
MSVKCKARLCAIIVIALTTFVLPKIGAIEASEDVVAVAASMHEVALELATAFKEARLGQAPQVVSGASGKLAAQIIAGAPFGLFLSASPEWTEKLQKDGFLYDIAPMAKAPAVVWWPKGEAISLETLRGEKIRIAIAGPAAAPFGKAAGEYLASIGLYDTLMKEGRLIVMGSVEQAMLAATSGGADMAMVSLSLAIKANEGSYVKLPIAPLENSGGLVKSRATENITEFWRYIRSEAAAPVWEKWGFEPVRDN